MICQYSGCNVPESECLGECMTQDSIESLEEIAKRHFLHGHEDDLVELLSDPAILAHIPAYAELKQQIEWLNEQLSNAYDNVTVHEAPAGMVMMPEDTQQRIADLESQLAALQAGPNASVLSEYINRMRVDFNSNGGFRIGDILAQAAAYLNDKQPAAPAVVPEGESEAETAWSVAGRLALELECLLLDTKDTAVVSKWWDTAHDALEDYRLLRNAAPCDCGQFIFDRCEALKQANPSIGCKADIRFRFKMPAAPNTQEKGE